jgi:hypothetical protein
MVQNEEFIDDYANTYMSYVGNNISNTLQSSYIDSLQVKDENTDILHTDWNSIFQQLLEEPDSLDKFKRLSKLGTTFETSSLFQPTISFMLPSCKKLR